MTSGGTRRIHIAEIDAGGAVLTERVREFDPTAPAEGYSAWMPNGMDLVYSAAYDSGKDIRIGPADGRGGGRRLGPLDPGDGLLFEIAPDGSGIAVVSYSRQRTWVVDVASARSRTSTWGPCTPRRGSAGRRDG